jgi:hypothetical protein
MRRHGLRRRDVDNDAATADRSTTSASGQATVEFALVIPLVLVVLLAVVQVAVVVYSQLAIMHTAREVARVVAVDPTASVGHLADTGSEIGSHDLDVAVTIEADSGTGSVVIVTVGATVPTVSGLFTVFSDHFDLSSTVRMRVEG